MGWKAFSLVTLVLCSCSARSSPPHSQRMEVGYRDNHGVDHTKVFTVEVDAPVRVSPAPWTETLAETGCQGQEGRTLVLTNAEHRSAQVGDACAWFDKLGPTSPDGQYLVAWVPTDGAASEIHLVALMASPADVVTVPHSNSVDYVATWTEDGRVWFTSDESPPSSTNRLFSYAPVSHRQDSMPVDNAILIRSARTL